MINQMTTFIVPTDFSDAAKNAAIFAAHAAASVQSAEVILYYSFDNYLAGSDGTPIADEPVARKQIAELALLHVQEAMQQAAGAVNVTYIATEEASFLASLEKFIAQKQPDLVIMGIKEASSLAQTFGESHTLDLVNKSVCPVLIIPHAAVFTGIKNVLLATDFTDVLQSVMKIEAVLNIFKPHVDIVHVSEAKDQPGNGFPGETQMLESMLHKYSHKYHYIRQHDVEQAITRFALQNKTDCIITVPHKHSFFNTLFSAGHTKKLAYHSHVPVLTIPEH